MGTNDNKKQDVGG